MHCLLRTTFDEGRKVHLRDMSPAGVLFVAQSVTTAVAGFVAWMAFGSAAAVAALFGGVTVIVPALYFAVRVGFLRKSAHATAVLGAFYQAEVGKLLLTALLFFIGALLFGAHFAPLMLTCVACLAMNWLTLVVARSE